MEEANEKDQDKSNDTSLFGPSMDTFIKTRRRGRKKRGTTKSRCLRVFVYSFVVSKLPDQVQRIYDEAMRCYINLDYDKVTTRIFLGK